MDTQKFKDFLRNLFTLRTVWIDKGQGQWSVKKRMHPLLRGVLCTLALIASLTVYAAMKNESLPEPEPAIAKMIEPEKPSEILNHAENLNLNANLNANTNRNASRSTSLNANTNRNNANQNSDKKTNQRTNRNQNITVLPLKPVAKKREIILPSEKNPNTDRIIIPAKKPEITKQREKPKVRRFNMPDDGKYRILVSKIEHKLWLLNGNDIVQEYSIATGRNPGDKQRVGDNRTPTGKFKIVSIENASSWSHDFHDGKGKIKGAYGPWFLRLDAKGWKGIGIHGTHDPDSRGTNATEGCIRLSNEDIDELKQYAYKNMPVIIREN